MVMANVHFDYYMMIIWLSKKFFKENSIYYTIIFFIHFEIYTAGVKSSEINQENTKMLERDHQLCSCIPACLVKQTSVT